MISNIKGCLIPWVVFIVSVSSWPVWGSSEVLNQSLSPESLEQELQHLLSAGMAQSQDPKELQRLASMYLDLGYALYVDPQKKMNFFQEGARLAKKALELDESSARAHFLYAANLGSATELEGVMQGVLTIQELKEHVHRTLELNEKYAPAHHMLGRMYEELPWFMGGDQGKAGKHLKKAILLDKYYAPGHLDLGRWYLKQGYEKEAIQEFRWVVETVPQEKIWIWERIYRPQAQNLLHQLHVSEKQEIGP